MVRFITDVIDLRLNEFIVDVGCLLYYNFHKCIQSIDTSLLFLLPVIHLNGDTRSGGEWERERMDIVRYDSRILCIVHNQ